ncbi:GTPase-associated system all-helical protein GASH [Stenotrophomonas sp. CFBP8980]|uniref:GTPase-associated system all-helical protein GASH n=1 Tax=Stenotrophomonas sp. CFBP8980 TaxID=3096523 RepID=UPI002A6AD37F|nr:GTPase-associated system all-helical protein GASH [Stenotrophomonas sp. CFBP8980]MDY1032144.1 GTPase-associated system all-helical protein GASH [Stenotrophomonas sp. CFBP8980]
MAKVPGMSSDFAGWYTDTFMDEGARRDMRWKGVVELAGKATHITVEVLARLAFRTVVPASGRKGESLDEEYASVLSTISGGDPYIDGVRDARELQVLAAATLSRLLGTMPDAALVVTTAAAGGLRKVNLPMDLVGLAESAIIALSARKHIRQNEEELLLAAPKVAFAVDGDNLATMQYEQFRTHFEKLHGAASAAIERVVTAQNRVVKQLHGRIRLGEEELQMLWWLTGGHSKSVNKPFGKVPDAARPLVLAEELGELTNVSPGPGSIRAMLARAGVGSGKVKLSDAVNTVGAEWAKSASTSALISPATTPIHFALEQRSEMGSTDAWQAGWSSLTGLSVDAQLPSAKLAELFYREHVFLYVES